MKDKVDICIRLNQGKDFILNNISTSQDTIETIKKLIASHISEKKAIRLIYQGQLLNNDGYTLNDYGIQPHYSLLHIHCALSDTPFIPTNTITCHTTSTKNVNEIAGFDKLRENGYNEEEIRNIRLQFHQLHAESTYIDGEPPNEQDVLLEEEWLEENGRILPEGSQNTFKEMMCGLLLGFFLGVLCLFWVRESVFTRRHQMGILAGMLINVSCGINYVYY